MTTPRVADMEVTMLCVLELAGQEQGESIITPAGIRMRFSEFGLVSTSLLLQTDSPDQIAFWPHISLFLFYKGVGDVITVTKVYVGGKVWY